MANSKTNKQVNQKNDIKTYQISEVLYWKTITEYWKTENESQ